MKLLFKNTTKYSKSVYDEFLKFHRKKYRFTYILYNVIVIALILFCLTVQVQYHNFSGSILFCIILSLFILWRYLHPIEEVTKEYNSDKIQKEKSFTFKFYDKFFTCEDIKEFSKFKYYKLHKVYETNNFFYLYIDKTHSFILDKTKFNENKSAEFSNFIKKKAFFRYRKDLNFDK